MDKQDSIQPLAQLIADDCDGLSLIEADRAFDDARRLLWLRQFSGASMEALDKQLMLPPSHPGRRIVERLDGAVTVVEAEQIFLEARMSLWMRVYIQIPQSRFFAQLQNFQGLGRKPTLN